MHTKYEVYCCSSQRVATTVLSALSASAKGQDRTANKQSNSHIQRKQHAEATQKYGSSNMQHAAQTDTSAAIFSTCNNQQQQLCAAQASYSDSDMQQMQRATAMQGSLITKAAEEALRRNIMLYQQQLCAAKIFSEDNSFAAFGLYMCCDVVQSIHKAVPSCNSSNLIKRMLPN